MCLVVPYQFISHKHDITKTTPTLGNNILANRNQVNFLYCEKLQKMSAFNIVLYAVGEWMPATVTINLNCEKKKI